MIYEYLLEKSYWVIDFLPQRVEMTDNVSFYAEVEEIFLQKEKRRQIARKFAEIILKCLCYLDFIIYQQGQQRNMTGSQLENAIYQILDSKQDELSIFFPQEETLLQMNSGNLYMTLYHPSKRIIELMKLLVQGEGLYLWLADNEKEKRK